MCCAGGNNDKKNLPSAPQQQQIQINITQDGQKKSPFIKPYVKKFK